MCNTSAGCCPYSQCVCVHVQDFCRVLSELHDKAPVHGWEASKAAIEKAFGLPVDQMFESIDHDAIASGSIAQVTALLPCNLHYHAVVLERRVSMMHLSIRCSCKAIASSSIAQVAALPRCQPCHRAICITTL